jgi:hypothetical protein
MLRKVRLCYVMLYWVGLGKVREVERNVDNFLATLGFEFQASCRLVSLGSSWKFSKSCSSCVLLAMDVFGNVGLQTATTTIFCPASSSARGLSMACPPASFHWSFTDVTPPPTPSNPTSTASADCLQYWQREFSQNHGQHGHKNAKSSPQSLGKAVLRKQINIGPLYGNGI